MVHRRIKGGRNTRKNNVESEVNEFVKNIEDNLKESSISPNVVYDILMFSQTLDYNCKDYVIKFNVSNLKGNNADATKDQLEHAHDEQFILFYPRYNTELVKHNIKRLNFSAKLKLRKSIKHYMQKCISGVNMVFSKLIDGTLLRALKCIEMGKDFNGRKISIKDVKLNKKQYNEVKKIIDLLSKHNKGQYSNLMAYLNPDMKDEKPKDENVVTNANINNDLLKFLGYNVDNVSVKKSNGPKYDPFGNYNDITKVFMMNSNTNKKNRSKTNKNKSKTNKNKSRKSSNVLRHFDPLHRNYVGTDKLQNNSKYKLSKLRSPSMQELNEKYNVPNGR
jgi:hypothetical protein